MLSLLHNEVVSKQYYRLYMINLVPSLKQLDFQKVTVKVSECVVRACIKEREGGWGVSQDVAQGNENRGRSRDVFERLVSPFWGFEKSVGASWS